MSNFTTVPDVTVGESFPPALWESAIMGNLNLGVTRQLADHTVSVAQSSVDFSSLPTTFAHLKIVILARGDTAAALTALNFRFNGDTAANYNYSRVIDGTALATGSDNNGALQVISADSAPANAFGAFTVWIPHYAQAATFKTWSAVGYYETGDADTNQHVVNCGGIWKATPAAINRITFFPGAGNFAAGSRFTIYGLPA